MTDAKTSKSYDNHEQVLFCDDPVSGLKAIIAIHNTNLGPAVGGCRMFPYDDDAQALEDVLRLSRGMTYKSALAGLPMGGGKAVIIGDPASDKSTQLFAKMGEFIESMNGRYVTAEDSGTSVSDLKVIATKTSHVLGVNEEQEFGGEYLIQLLHQAGAKTKVCDVNLHNLRRAQEFGAQVVGVEDIISTAADVFAPCAMGAVLNDKSIPKLAAPIVAGGANNQLASLSHASMLKSRGVLYAPDFVINAGGIIEICRQQQESSMEDCRKQIANIANTLTTIFVQSDATGDTTAQVAEALAEQKIGNKINRDIIHALINNISE